MQTRKSYKHLSCGSAFGCEHIEVSAVAKVSHSFATQALLAHGAMCRGEVIDEIVDPRGALRLLLIDLRHWAQKEKIDYQDIDAHAQIQFCRECVP
jgi:hypothetical protein